MVPASAADNGPVNFPSRTRFVAHPRACSVGGGSFASSSDGSRVVIAGNDVLRLVKVSDINRQSNEHSNARLSVGPGGATIETTPNMWPSSGLKVDSAPTDVIWGRGAFDNKIVTSARNGEIIFWDVSRLGNKLEGRIREHKRAINQLALSPCLSYLFASGSQDGYLRLWDFRSPSASVLKVYHAAGIRTLALCPVPSHPIHVCVGLESGTIQRWDLRSKAQPLERITLAHSCAVLSMDWQSPSMNESGLGWIVTSGMDRRVKIWDLTLHSSNITTLPEREKALSGMKMGAGGPMRTLHPSFIGRHVKWRQGCNTEVAIVSNIDSDSDSIVEIWDIRRGWIGKWALQHGAEGVEGSVTDFAFASNNVLHTLHTSGAFVQYDLLHSLIKPLDAVPRNAVAWSATGEMAFANGLKTKDEIPFDDDGDFNKPKGYDRFSKATNDPPYIPTDQMLGIVSISRDSAPKTSTDFNTLLGVDANRVARLAKQYIFRSRDIDGGRKEVCVVNARVANEEGDEEAARVWTLLTTLLDDSINIACESTGNEVQSPPPHPLQSSLTSIREGRSMSITLNNKTEESQTKPSRRSSASSSNVRPLPTAVTSSSSPGNHSSTVSAQSQEKNDNQKSTQRQQDPQTSPVSMYDASISSAGMGGGSTLGSESIARRSPSIFPARSRPDFRRGSVSIANPIGTSIGRIGGNLHLHVGEGALDSSDDEGDDMYDNARKSNGSDGAVQRGNGWKKSQLTTMMEERRKPRDDGSTVPMSVVTLGLSLPEDGHRDSASPGLLTRSGSAKSFSESFANLQSQRPAYPRLSLSPIRDVEQSKLNKVNTKSGSASTSSSSFKVQMSKGQQDRPSASLSSSSSSFSKPASQGAAQSSNASSVPSMMRARSGRTLLTPSPLSRVFTPQLRKGEGSVPNFASALRTESPDGHLADEEEEGGSYGSGSGSGSHSGSGSEGIVSDLDSDLEVEDGSDDSVRDHPPRLSVRSNSVPIPLFVGHNLNDSASWNARERAPSKSSIRTVTVAVPSRPPSILSDKDNLRHNADTDGDQASTSEFVTVGQESLASTRRPSPSPIPGGGPGTSVGTGLGLSIMAPDDNGGSGSLFNVSIHRLRPINLAVPSLERRWRDLVWKGVKESFEGFSETGNVQMCALLAMLVPKELKLGKAAVRRYIEAYIELLSRLRHHVLAAHVRKYAHLDPPENTLQVAIYTACGRCNTAIRPIPLTNAVLLCPRCKSQPNYCSICHLPARNLFTHCSVCGHGGHETCYRSYITTRPPTELPSSHGLSSLSLNPFNLFILSANSQSGSSYGSSVTIEDSTSTYYSFSDGTDHDVTSRTTASNGDEASINEDCSDLITTSSNATGSDPATDALRKVRLASSNRAQVWGYACPTGCGHWCWGTNQSNKVSTSS